jgi:hypothetical protein
MHLLDPEIVQSGAFYQWRIFDLSSARKDPLAQLHIDATCDREYVVQSDLVQNKVGLDAEMWFGEKRS